MEQLAATFPQLVIEEMIGQGGREPRFDRRMGTGEWIHLRLGLHSSVDEAPLVSRLARPFRGVSGGLSLAREDS